MTIEGPLEIEHPLLTGDPAPLLAAAEDDQSRLPRGALDWRQALGAVLVLAGVVLLAVGWWGVSGTGQSFEQLPYFLSGGLGGGALVAAGLTVLIAYEHHLDRQAMSRLEARLREYEQGLAVEVEALADRVVDLERRELDVPEPSRR